MNLELTYALAVLVGIVSAGRVTRLLAQDLFPPTAWLRGKWDAVTNDGPWSLLMHCHWCLSPYVTAGIGAWGWFSDLHWTWWAVNGWLAASYAVAMLVERDEKE